MPAALLTYLTCDNVDGPHARRSGQTSTLGEFLDHGLDGVASGAVLLTSAAILRMDGIWYLLLVLLGAIGFAMPFWEQFRTGVLVIPEISSTEGITTVVVLDLLIGMRRNQGATLVVVTHDPAVAELADRRIHLADGRIVREDSA